MTQMRPNEMTIAGLYLYKELSRLINHVSVKVYCKKITINVYAMLGLQICTRGAM